MIPVAFDYAAPTSIAEALALLGEAGEDGKILAGGFFTTGSMDWKGRTQECSSREIFQFAGPWSSPYQGEWLFEGLCR